MTTHTGVRLISDQPVSTATEDRLGFTAYAGVFAAQLLARDTPTPFTVTLSGPWGCGKTSLARILDERLGAEENWGGVWREPPIRCWFNAWHHADAPNVGVALAAHVARTLGPLRALWWRVLQPLPSAMLLPARRAWRRAWQGAIAAVVALAAVSIALWRFPELRSSAGAFGTIFDEGVSPLLIVTAGGVIIAIAGRAFRMGSVLGAYLEAPQSVAAQGAVADVRAHLGRLVKQSLRQPSALDGPATAGSRRLILFIDDLERCPAAQALTVCEVVAQLLDHPGVVVILICDLNPIAAEAARQYQAVSDPLPGERYLDKLINLRFNLPPLSSSAVGRLLDHSPRTRDR